jgi:hypothetical protein
MIRQKLLVIAISICMIFVGCSDNDSNSVPKGPDRILYNGKVFTSNTGKLWAEAIAVDGERITAVGGTKEILALADSKTDKIDLAGHVVIPGLNDAHVHVTLFPESTFIDSSSWFPFLPGPTLAETLDILKEAADKTPAGQWILMVIDLNVLEDPAADRYAIDAVVPDHPVRLEFWAGHGTILNTAAIKWCGFSETEPDPEAGSFERIPGTMIINGRIHEYVEHIVRGKLAAAKSVADARSMYLSFSELAARFGFTSIQEIPIGVPVSQIKEIMDGIDLPIRWRVIPTPAMAPWDTPAKTVKKRESGYPKVTYFGAKYLTDGSPPERYAAVEEEYNDKPGWFGVENFERFSLKNILTHLAAVPVGENQAVIHTVGDRAINTYLELLDETGGEAVWKNRRPRLEHGDLLFPEILPIMARNNVILVQNPLHFADTALFPARYGEERTVNSQLMQSVLDAGVQLAIGSDILSIVPDNPFLEIMFAFLHPNNPAEAVSIEDAVIAYTNGSAYAEFEEKNKGTIAPGMLADIAVLSQDIFAIQADLLPATKSVLTLVGGEIVYDAGLF